MRVSRVLVALALAFPLSGCGALVGASIEAGFRDLTDHGKHPLYENKSYGEHFVDALLEDDEPRSKREVEVQVTTRRHR